MGQVPANIYIVFIISVLVKFFWPKITAKGQLVENIFKGSPMLPNEFHI